MPAQVMLWGLNGRLQPPRAVATAPQAHGHRWQSCRGEREPAGFLRPPPFARRPSRARSFAGALGGRRRAGGAPEPPPRAGDTGLTAALCGSPGGRQEPAADPFLPGRPFSRPGSSRMSSINAPLVTLLSNSKKISPPSAPFQLSHFSCELQQLTADYYSLINNL